MLQPRSIKDHVAHQSGNDGNSQIGDRKNIFNGESPGFSPATCTTEFPHQEIGIEQKDYETDLNDRSPNWG
jgi:hypothetical protein